MKARVLLAAIVSVCAMTAAAQGQYWGLSEVTVLPEKPISDDPILITGFGYWQDSCVPQTAEAVVDGETIEVKVYDDSPGRICLTAISEFEVTAGLAPLPAGTYDL